MSLFYNLESTWLSLKHHAFRSLLAMLGVVLGVAAVVGMLAVSEGARVESIERIRRQGVDNIILHSEEPQANATGGENIYYYGITSEDIAHFKTALDNVKKVVPVVGLRQTIYANGRPTDVVLVGADPEFLNISRSENADPRGRWISELDGVTASQVCSVGVDAARQLFGLDDPLGKTVSVYGATFEVVGLLNNPLHSKLAGKYDINNMVYVEYDTLLSIFNRDALKVEADYVYIQVQDLDYLKNTADRIRTYLAGTHELPDYTISVPYELLLAEQATQRVFAVVMGSIAAISLLVGGIGIMNIMLANIYERTKEIGTLRALGAQRRTILTQFLFEAVTLTGLGGVLGVGIGFLIALLIKHTADMPTIVTPGSVIVALTVSIMTGIIFGTHPAWKAANLSPIEALRR
ncbi:MAG: ABC transporter permease [Kiritimatiellales bacterium]|nr:ABC transporter permease [Kiritimatiellota bacterium]MBL7012296.1 ABC transporter permease [Kiritimatiellales bacterium]